MLFKGEKSMPDTEGPEKRNPGNREFMREKIVKQPLSKRQIAKRVLILMCLAVLFGVISAVSFVLAKPLADRYLGREETEESMHFVYKTDNLFQSIRISYGNSSVTKGFHFLKLI